MKRWRRKWGVIIKIKPRKEKTKEREMGTQEEGKE